MASNSRPLLLDLRDEDFQRGYTGSRPPSLISPEPKRSVAPQSATVPQPRSGKGKTIVLFLAAIAASVITSKLLSNGTAEHTTVGVEAAQKVEAPRAEAPPPPPPAPVAAPVVAEVAKPVVQTAVVAPVAPHPKPIAAAAAPKPVAKAAPAKSAEENPAETKEEPKAATPTYGVEEAGF